MDKQRHVVSLKEVEEEEDDDDVFLPSAMGMCVLPETISGK